MSIESDALIREVREELRREQLKRIWDRYGTYLLAGVAAVIIGTAVYIWFDTQHRAAADAAGAEFEQALNLAAEGKSEPAARMLETIGRSGTGGYATMAKLALAGEAAKAGKTAEAVTAYEAIAEGGGTQLTRDFARLQVAALKIDSADWTEIQNRLKDLTVESSPWRYSARELMGLAALRAGKLSEAREVLAPLSSDPRAPGDIRERAGALMNLVVEAELAKGAPASVELEPVEAPPAPNNEPPKPTNQDGTKKPDSLLDKLRRGEHK
ncbi:MAG: tetratricopeptide repeat protein [Hyphomicrobiaceae bacterium]